MHFLTQSFNVVLSIIFLLTTVTHSTLLLAAQDDVAKQAENLIRKRDFNTAYQLLEPLEAERAGNVDYDYLLGVAAVESGNATRGAFALERVLAIDPKHKDARAQMAKAHFMLGEIEASKTEFNNVLKQNPDTETKKAIDKLLNAIDKIEGNATIFVLIWRVV